MQSGCWLWALSTAVLACSPATQTSPPPGSPVAPARRTRVSIERATWQARSAFDSAARAGDTTRVAAFFVEDALLISSAGDSIRGRDAIARYLAQLVPGVVSADFSFGREGSVERCVGAARERLAYAAHINYAGRSPDTVSGNLSVIWKRDSTGALKVAWAALSEREIRRGLGRSECPSREDSIWRAWRFAVTVVPVPVADIPEAKGSFGSFLRASGWVDECVCGGTLPVHTPASESTRLLPPSLVGIQYHLRRHVVGEILGGRIPKGSTMGAQFFTNRDFALTRLSYSGVFVGALASYEHWGLHLGVGPALQLAHWVLRDSLRPSGGLPTTTDFRWSTLPLGIVADARFHRLVGDRLFLAVRAQVRRFQKVRTPSTPRFPSAMVAQGTSLVAVGWGVLF
jgi:ketosteroid isomerase-like protein